MTRIYQFAFFLALGLLIGCGGKVENTEGGGQKGQEPKMETQNETSASDAVPASERITLDNKGVGKIKNVDLNPTVDQDMVDRGEALFKANCTACHKGDKRFIGPSPTGIMDRRSPEWIMNMILDPKLMTEQDQLAKDLLVEFNGAAMANQNLTEEQARDILEYFRTLK
ncbi:cytochrome c [Algoriphagus persicinus]|uniref:cytochrome c n=1 Tax=Algoriphagus persicinus TaxID=3108754 RepID=UPI002B364484|nr:cytochrome c [Algoriphagus sp. E1-3-M2]MEB2786235.1 cytochrome c [Algoriphagus sp. E1-3-M2]